jgi:two-component system, LytTR family, sensor kinase
METRHIRSDSPRWIWIALTWLGFGLVDAMQTVFVMRAEGMHHAWGKLFLTSALSWLAWALATPLILRLGQRFPPAKSSSAVTWLVHIAGCAAIALASAAWLAWLSYLLNPFG